MMGPCSLKWKGFSNRMSQEISKCKTLSSRLNLCREMISRFKIRLKFKIKNKLSPNKFRALKRKMASRWTLTAKVPKLLKMYKMILSISQTIFWTSNTNKRCINAIGRAVTKFTISKIAWSAILNQPISRSKNSNVKFATPNFFRKHIWRSMRTCTTSKSFMHAMCRAAMRNLLRPPGFLSIKKIIMELGVPPFIENLKT